MLNYFVGGGNDSISFCDSQVRLYQGKAISGVIIPLCLLDRKIISQAISAAKATSSQQ